MIASLSDRKKYKSWTHKCLNRFKNGFIVFHLGKVMSWPNIILTFQSFVTQWANILKKCAGKPITVCLKIWNQHLWNFFGHSSPDPRHFLKIFCILCYVSYLHCYLAVVSWFTLLYCAVLYTFLSVSNCNANWQNFHKGVS